MQSKIDALPKALPESPKTFQAIDTGLEYRLQEFDARCKSILEPAGRLIRKYSAAQMHLWGDPRGNMLHLALENAQRHYGIIEEAAQAFKDNVRLMDKLVG